MRITLSSTLLASANLALRRVGPQGMACNGEPVTQVEQLFRADFATIYDRGDGPVQFSFSVLADFDTEAELISFVATHREALPRQAILTLVDDAGTYAATLPDACRKVSFGSVRGNSVLVEYSFTGSRFTSSAVPGVTDPTEDIMKVGVVALNINDETAVIVFPVAFGSGPTSVQCIVSAPSGGLKITADLDESTLTTAGVTARLSMPIPATGYKLRWLAVI